MNIVFCLDSNLIYQVCVMLTSLQFNNKNSIINFYAFILNPTERDKNLLSRIINKQNNLTVFDICDSDLENLQISSNYISKATYLRFFIEDKLDLNIQKVLYLDCDLIICKDLKSLYDIDISNYSLAACYDLEVSDIRRYNRLGYDVSEEYFNAGVLLINLDYWRKNNISHRCISFLKENIEKCVLYDQDALNYFLHGTVCFISSKYNVLYDFFNANINNFLISNRHKAEILMEINEPVIIHYAGRYKPWFCEYHKYNFPFGKLWKKYLQLSNLNFKIKNMKLYNNLSVKNIIKYCLVKTGLKKISYPIFTDSQKIELSLL